MQFARYKPRLSGAATAISFVGLVWLAWVLLAQRPGAIPTPLYVQAQRPANRTVPGATLAPSPQVVVGTPVPSSATPPPQRYTYRNEFAADRSKPLPLYIIDTQTGQETRLGDDTDAAFFGTLDERYLLWYFGGLHIYTLATATDTLVSKSGDPSIHPKMKGDWVAFGDFNGGSSQLATLFAANLQTHEIITLTRALPAENANVTGYFGISPRLAAWYGGIYPALPQIVVYDLAMHKVVTTLTDFATAFNEQFITMYSLSPGETVVTWSRNYGYDLVTGSYFHIPTLYPPDWDNHPIVGISPITEQGRTLFWAFSMEDGSKRYFQAPLLDATPSAAPCIDGQNLVQNSDLEDIATHNVWQQSSNLSDLIVNDLPPNAPQAGQWAIRLGRYSNAQQTIQQILNIPSNVKHITLAFDVRASSWDIWGGDQLQVDLIDPVTNQSILATPVQWTNRQLANGGWIPLQVDIQDWPGIDTPLYLVFRTQTDWAFPTDFTIDNIGFITSCA